ncbi:MAG TPA: phage tail sheath subtilisin-like domain-containing protein [Thermoleophilia bacterium]|nr:phage tail sheath subtilisin-like domain-containing protein [Thermoleophilia bacterium]
MANIIVPGGRYKISDLRTGSLFTASKVLVFGIKTAGSLPVNTPTQVFSPDEAAGYAGRGSQAHQEVAAVFGAYRSAEVTLVLLAAAGAAAAGTLTYAGAATTATPIILQVEDQSVVVPVNLGDAFGTVAAAADEAVNDLLDLHVTSGVAAGVQTLTARSAGAHGNQIQFKVLQNTPGITVAEVAMSAGAGDPDLASAIAVLGGERYKYWVLPDTGALNLTAAIAELDDRWTESRQIDGHAFIGRRDTVGTLATLGLGEDTKHITIFGDPYVPANPWAWAGRVAGLRASIENPKLTLYDDDIPGLVAPDETDYLQPADQQTLLSSGIATFHFVAGKTRVQRMVTLYKSNGLGQPSEIFQDAETKLTAGEIRQLQITTLRPHIGKTLVDDIGAVQYAVDTADKVIDAEGVRQMMISLNREVFQARAWTDNADYYEANLQVVRSGPNELTINTSPPIPGTNYINTGTIDVVTAFSVQG